MVSSGLWWNYTETEIFHIHFNSYQATIRANNGQIIAQYKPIRKITALNTRLFDYYNTTLITLLFVATDPNDQQQEICSKLS
jgi:hypothetical protein